MYYRCIIANSTLLILRRLRVPRATQMRQPPLAHPSRRARRRGSCHYRISVSRSSPKNTVTRAGGSFAAGLLKSESILGSGLLLMAGCLWAYQRYSVEKSPERLSAALFISEFWEYPPSQARRRCGRFQLALPQLTAHPPAPTLQRAPA
jgi:hypothetical protein